MNPAYICAGFIYMADQELLLASRISRFPRGTVFFVEDLLDTGLPEEVLRVLLSRMSRTSELFIRLGRGIYCYPDVTENFCMVIPSVWDVCSAVAVRHRCRIAPSDGTAAGLCGLRPLSDVRYDFVTTGSDLSFLLSTGKSVFFRRRVSQKVFSFRSDRMRNLAEGLRYIGEENITEEDVGRVGECLLGIPFDEYYHDLKLCPGWMRKILVSVRNPGPEE